MESCSHHNNDIYTDRLLKLNILPISIYLELLDLLTFSRILNDQYNFEWHSALMYAPDRKTRSGTRTFEVKKIKLSKSRINFFYRVQKLVNLLPPSVKFFCPQGLKPRLLNLFCNFYLKDYDTNRSCTWRKVCNCNNCLANPIIGATYRDHSCQLFYL